MGRVVVRPGRVVRTGALLLACGLAVVGVAAGYPIARAEPARAPITDPAAPPGSAVVHRELSVAGGTGPVTGDVIEVDLTRPGVRAGLLTAGAVSARASVPAMAARAGALAAVNGDYFDLGGSNAPAGPQVRGGYVLSSAVPQGRRAAPAVPGAETDAVFAIGTDGRARIDRLPLRASVRTPRGTLPVQALNQFAVPVDGIGIVTRAWGAADRGRTLCGSDTDRQAACAPDRVEVLVRNGVVAAVRPPGAGALGQGETVLLGRDRGAVALRGLRVGDPVHVAYRLVPASGVTPVTAVGGSPVLVGGAAPGGLDAVSRAPRSAVGIANGGRRLLLVTVDGRETTSVGITLAALSDLLARLGAQDGMNLDGGGSSTLVARGPADPSPRVVNTPSEDATRLVPNALAVFGPGAVAEEPAVPASVTAG